MTIYCFDSTFSKIEHRFDSIDELLKVLVGSRNLADKALNDPENSYRGFRLVDESKIAETIQKVYADKNSVLEKEFGDKIESLESEVKRIKKERSKAVFKVEELQLDNDSKIADVKASGEKELVELSQIQDKILTETLEEHEVEKSELTQRHEAIVKNIKYQTEKEHSELVGQVKSLELEKIRIEEDYKHQLVERRREHLNELEKTQKKHKTNNENILSISMDIQKDYEDFTQIIQNIINKDKVKYSEIFDSLNFLDKNPIHKNSQAKTTEKALDTIKNPAKKEVKETVKLAKQIVPEKVAVVEKPIVVEKVKEVVPEQVVFKNKPTIKGVELILNAEYLGYTQKEKVDYIAGLYRKGLLKEDFVTEYTSYKYDLENKNLVVSLIHRLYSLGIEHVTYEVDFNKDLVQEALKTYKVPTAKINAYLNLIDRTKDIAKEPEVKAEILSHSKNNPKRNNPFKWAKFLGVLESKESVNYILAKPTIQIKELTPATKFSEEVLSEIINLLKKEGYTKAFPNERVLDKQEALFVIATASIATSNKNTTYGQTVSILYPSWKNYLNTVK